MESKKINQLATNVAPQSTDLTIIGDPITGVSKKITWLQVSTLIGTAANLQQVTDNGATTTNPIAIGGLTITGLATGVLKSDSGVISSVPYGAANGVATLGGDGKVPSSQLPSYVDDVIEVANYAALPVTGATGVLYITLDTNKIYRWTGSTYVEIADSSAVWGAITGTLSNQTDLQNALNAKQNAITLTTTGTSGAATLVGATLNIPNYGSALSGYVPYTGATANVDLGTFDLTADLITGATGSFASSGGSDTFAINHSSGSGIALNITKGGAGEGLYINKTSGSGNAVTIIGTLNATTLVKDGGTSSQFLKADGSVDSSTYLTTSSAASTYVPYTGATANVDLGIYNMSAAYYKSTNGYVMGQGSTVGLSGSFTVIGATPTSLNIVISNTKTFLLTFPSTSRTYTYPDATGTLALTSDLSGYIQGSGTTNYVPKFTASGTIGNSLIYDTGTRIAIGGTSATYGVLTVQSDAGQFCIQSNTTPGKQLQIGYDHTTNNSYLTSLNQGVAFTPLALQPNGGNVGVGTSSPTDFGSTYTTLCIDNATNGGVLDLRKNGVRGLTIAVDGSLPRIEARVSGEPLVFSTNNGGTVSERMRITSGGNVGIGTSSPVNYTNYRSLHISGATSTSSAILYLTNSTESIRGLFFAEGSANRVTIGSQSNHDFTFVTNDTERMRITSGGSLLVGTTANSQTEKFNVTQSGVNWAQIINHTNSTQFLIDFRYNGTGTGSIIATGGVTSYNVTSDYRLKEDFKQFNGLDLISRIKTYDFQFKSSKLRMYGFIAHELQEVIPYAVFGEKDAEEMQQVDYSKLTPVNTKAIQELYQLVLEQQEMINELKALIATK